MVYRKAYDAAMEIFRLTESWPRGEMYSMIDQIRRSSRSICSNIAEGWRRRHFPKHFRSKLIDADSEVSETETWLEFGVSCNYLSKEDFDKLEGLYDEVHRMLWSMYNRPDAWKPD